jgi:eukaryotic-like serine/threonine-protein kinase
MTELPSTRGEEDVLVAFLMDLGQASAPEAVLERHCAMNPACADALRALYAAEKLLLQSRPAATAAPTRLGDFRIIRELARGGMGVIFEAEQEPLGRRVAVKTIREDRLRASPEARERFLREQDALTRLHHTNIVSIHAAGQVSGLHYFAMPLIEGAALSDVIESAWRHETTEHAPDTPPVSKLATTERRTGDYNTNSVPRNPRRIGPHEAAVSIRLSISAAYVRSVAQVMADAADAIQHAHDADVLHRDLKPTNLMVDCHEHCWVLDFGLARIRRVTGHERIDAPSESLASGKMGTPLYMAPEQFECLADERTDVWGLAATLYEFLTLRRAFHAIDQIRSAEPRPMRELVANPDLDLEAICRKGMKKNPAERYQTARDLGDDLRRWLRHEPVTARPARTPRRVALWSRRNKGWAAAILFAAFAVTSLAVAGVAMGLQKRRESMLEKLDRTRLTTRAAGWSDVAGKLIVQLSSGGKDDQLQAKQTAIMSGLDASVERTVAGPTDFVAFAPSGDRLWMSGPAGLRRANVETGATELRVKDASGPIAFRADDSAVMLAPARVRQDAQATGVFPVTLWNGSTGLAERTLADPLGGGRAEVVALALSADASLAGAAVLRADGSRQVVLWRAATGAVLKTLDYPGRGLAFSPDASLVATWDDSGRIDLWSLPGGESLGFLTRGTNQVLGVAFSRNHWKRESGPKPTADWLLAAGDHGGMVTIWDLQYRTAWATCPDSLFEVTTLAFSPDGTLLATGGRDHVRLWDVATGKFLLSCSNLSETSGVAFSRDGRRLATAGPGRWVKGEVNILSLSHGRGIRTLNGLTSPVMKLCVSADGRAVAASSHDWRVAVWDHPSGRLRCIVDAPRGDFADNVGLALSPDGRRLAFSTLQKAMLWDAETGRVLDSWELPPGFVDALVFDAQGRLLLMRAETADGKVRPYGNDAAIYPRVCALRELLPGKTMRAIAVRTDFPLHLNHIEPSPDGRAFVLEGSKGSKENFVRSIVAIDAEGKTLWTRPHNVEINVAAPIDFDPSGNVVAVAENQPRVRLFLKVVTNERVGEVRERLQILGPDAATWITVTADDTDPPKGFELFERGRPERLVKILAEDALRVRFTPDGGYLLWGNRGGTVSVADLSEMKRRLGALGMGW